MGSTVLPAPDQDLAALAEVLALLRQAQRWVGAAGEVADAMSDTAARADVERSAHLLDELLSAQAPSAVLRTCAVLIGPEAPAAGASPSDVLTALERALAAVMDVIDTPTGLPGLRRAGGGADAAAGAADPSIPALFPAYRSLRHLAGAERVHPAELWSGPADGWPGGPVVAADPEVLPRACDASSVADLEAALLQSLRRPQASSFQQLSDLCAALGAGDDSDAATLWRLASAVFEAQALRLLEPDLYLKRLGSPLLSLARSVAGRGAPAAADDRRWAGLAHELWFFGVHAAPIPGGALAPRLSALRRALEPVTVDALPDPGPMRGEPPPWASEAGLPPSKAAAMSDEVLDATRADADTGALLTARPAGTPRSLLEAVPDLPSWSDLDLSAPTPTAGIEGDRTPDEAMKQVGPLRIEIERFNRFLVEADELSRQLGTALSEWSVAAGAPLSEGVVAYAQALAVESAAIGHADLSDLCAALARALAHSAASAASAAFDSREATLFLAVHEEVSRLLHSFAAGFLKKADAQWLRALQSFVGDSIDGATLSPALAPLMRQADAARERMAEALSTLRAQALQGSSALELEALQSLDHEVQTLSALFDDLCARWPVGRG